MERLAIENVTSALLDPRVMAEFSAAMNEDRSEPVEYLKKAELNQSDLQFIRQHLKTYIQVISAEVGFCKKAADYFHENCDVNDYSAESQVNYRNHQIYRNRMKEAKKVLTKLENLQRKIRIDLSKGIQ